MPPARSVKVRQVPFPKISFFEVDCSTGRRLSTVERCSGADMLKRLFSFDSAEWPFIRGVLLPVVLVALTTLSMGTAAIRWADAVIELNRNPLDLKWIDANFGVWLAKTFGQDEVYILDDRDEPIVASIGTDRVATQEFNRVRSSVSELVAGIRGNSNSVHRQHVEDLAKAAYLKTGQAVHDAHLLELLGRPAAVSVMKIIPESEAVPYPHRREFLLLSIRFLNGSFVTQLSERNLIDGLRFADTDSPQADHVIAIVRESGGHPHRIELEVTESVLLDEDGGIADALRKLREAGFRIALDDFGTGYSSLGYLHRFEVDKIKIDRSFTQSLGQGSKAAAVVKAIFALGHAMSVTVTAEGVETEVQRNFLNTAGCNEMQGFLFSKAVSEEQLTRLLSRPSPTKAQNCRGNLPRLSIV